jgi:hypothetical protein
MRFVKFIFGGGGGYNTFLNSSKELTDNILFINVFEY